ncbi:MAG: 16S rRNA (cytosine(1402)-N(4))-methyltransferase RsmH [Bacteroidetes bacterium]|nr:16S rRNA (cytosine(1402)-N(4))-methyltransferase RsmH [Bacteroidota bacterium]
MSNTNYHLPVMASQCIEGLNIHPDGVYVDVTFGGGGHSKLILEKLGSKGVLIAFDRDDDAQQNTINDPRLIMVHHNYRFMKNFLKLHKHAQVNGILADLGVSSYQLNEGERGFSYRFDADLDMRMDRQQNKSAYTVINEYSQQQLFEIFKNYADLPQAYKLSLTIHQRVAVKKINTTNDFIEVIKPFAPKHDEYSFYSRVFQAIRIEVNDEIKSLAAFLNQTFDCLLPSGRLVVLSYHSIEDRMVKNLINKGSVDGEIDKNIYGHSKKPFKAVGKDLPATAEEIQLNSRARSARLRVAEKIVN